LVSVDVANINSHLGKDRIETTSILLRDIIKRVESQLHGDQTNLIVLAVKSTVSFLDEIEQIPPASLYIKGKERRNPINLWAECRRLTQNTNPILYKHTDRAFSLCNQIILMEQDERQRDTSQHNEKKAAINELREELGLIRGYYKLKHNQSITKCIRFGLAPILVLFAFMVPFGLFNFAASDLTQLNDHISSDGDKVLIPNENRYVQQMAPQCVENRSLKQQAVNTFYKHSLRKAIALLDEYLNSCPEDAEAQIYLNNYHALVDKQNSGSRRPIIKLAAVVPLLRPAGITDSFQMLRGIALAQNKVNNTNPYSQANPLVLIRLINDGPHPETQNSETEMVKGELAKMAAKSVVALSSSSNLSPSVVGVIGHFSSGSTEAASKIYNLHEMPVISPTSTNLREDIHSNRYRFNGVSIMHSILAYTPSGFAETFQSNYGAFRSILDQHIFGKWPVEEGLVDLDPNIYRMPPTDADAQNLIFSYLGEFNSANKHQIRKIIVISEDINTSKYSRNFTSLLKRDAEKNGYKDRFVYEPCHFYPGPAIVKEAEKCRAEVLSNPEESKALVVIPSSNNVKRALGFIKSIVDDYPSRQNLIIFGADSLLSAFDQSKDDLGDTTFIGTIITAASTEGEARFPLDIKKKNSASLRSLRLTWRSQMSYDSVIVFHDVLSRAFKSKYSDQNIRGLRRYLTTNIANGVRSQFSNREGLVEFMRDTHDRNIRNNSSMNILLCVARDHSGRIYFRDLEKTRDRLCKT
jgi:ABC-type branched-subunit amino acid transport system substrate-binding protein